MSHMHIHCNGLGFGVRVRVRVMVKVRVGVMVKVRVRVRVRHESHGICDGVCVCMSLYAHGADCGVGWYVVRRVHNKESWGWIWCGGCAMSSREYAMKSLGVMWEMVQWVRNELS